MKTTTPAWLPSGKTAWQRVPEEILCSRSGTSPPLPAPQVKSTVFSDTESQRDRFVRVVFGGAQGFYSRSLLLIPCSFSPLSYLGESGLLLVLIRRNLWLSPCGIAIRGIPERRKYIFGKGRTNTAMLRARVKDLTCSAKVGK